MTPASEVPVYVKKCAGKTLVAAICMAVFWLWGCESREVAPRKDFGETVAVGKTELSPLDHALQILGISEADLGRPSVFEENYHLSTRLPLVDRLGRSPFTLQHWADQTSEMIQQKAAGGLFEIFSFMYHTFNDGRELLLSDNDPKRATMRLADAYAYLYRLHGKAPARRDLDRIQQACFSETFDGRMGDLVVALADASLAVKKAVSGLTRAEFDELDQHPEKYLFPDGHAFNFLTAPTHVPGEVNAIASRIDLAALIRAAGRLAAAADALNETLRNSGPGRLPLRPACGVDGTILKLPTPIGDIVVNGYDDQRVAETAALLVDLGGNDTYGGSIGAGNAVPGRVAVVIDASGNDIYASGAARFAHGAGSLSIGMLIDLNGDDQYSAGEMGQGCGIFGVGLLADFNGNDVYRMGLLGQGFGLFGISLLLDVAGRDQYIIGGLGQGVGATMGFGLLCDRKGNDKYLANREQVRGRLVPDEWSHVQGVGLSVRSPHWDQELSFYGGIGFLSDGEGDDFYFADSENCMGGSYFMSIGALVDHGGNDRYIPQKGLGLGWAVHFGSAVFIDRRGNDVYYGGGLTGGAASDHSLAVFADYEGDDIYGPSEETVRVMTGGEAAASRQGADETDERKRLWEQMAQNAYGSAKKPKALGLLMDYRGNDRYFASPTGKGESLGGVMPPVQPEDWSRAILFDLGGQDVYSLPGKKDNHYFKYLGHGLCYDRVWQGSMPGEAPAPVQAFSLESLPVQIRGRMSVKPLRDLLDPDLYKRFAAKGAIRHKGGSIYPDIVDVLRVSGEEELNRELLEVLDALMLDRKHDRGRRWEIEVLLEAVDPAVRIFAARQLGLRRDQRALAALLQASRQESALVRSHVLWAIGRLQAPASIERLTDIVRDDPSPNCRREGVKALAQLFAGEVALTEEQIGGMQAVLLIALDDPDVTVRTSAAKALVHLGEDAAVLAGLSNALEDREVYLQRAAAMSLILNGEKSAIPVLIETLKFPSIDTFENYDHELARELAFFCGTDFSGPNRYDYRTWKDWWQAHGSEVDLRENLKIMKRIVAAAASPEETRGMALFDALRSEYPENIVIRKRYVRFCEEWITYRLLAQPVVDETILRRSLRLQRKLMELDPENAERWVSCAYFYFRLERIEEAVAAMETALKMNPAGPDYRFKLDQYRLLLSKDRRSAG